jgi:DNA mismatch repair protein MutS2
MDNAAMEYDDGSESPTYRLRLGRPGRSRGLEIAHRMGVHGAIVERARELLGGQHLELEHWLDRLERLESELEGERRAAAAASLEVERLRQRAASELERLEGERRELPRQLIAERDRLRRRAQERLDVALGRLDAALEERRELGRRQRQKLRDEALDVDAPSLAPPPVEGGLRPGMRVRIGSLGGVGELAEERGSRALVVIGGKRLWVERGDLRAVARGEDVVHPPKVVVEVGEEAERELRLLGLDSEQARADLERFLDQAFSAGARAVRVVHGHGTGALRRMVDEVCRHHPAVQSFRHPPQGRGGSGVTEVELAV